MKNTDVMFADAVEKKTKKGFESIDVSEEEYYSHPTFRIENLAEYIRLVTMISSISDDYIGWDTVVYRGMADRKYDLLPGLARYKNLKEDGEYILVNDFLARRPDAFQGLTEFDTLAKMQHYGLPTRLLDFTTNPLVALYFACESKYSNTGRVLCHGSYLQNDSSRYVNAICTAVIKKPLEENFTVDDYICNERMPLNKYLAESYLYDETTIVKPKYWNQRIANQSGVFLIFPNDLSDRYMFILRHSIELGIEKAIEQYGRGKIDKRRIEDALRIEPIEGYTKEEYSIMSDEYFRKMYYSYRDEMKEKELGDVFANRFRMSRDLKALSTKKIHNGFCSIMIEGKNKKKILKDLSYIGIGADYIYPELEYTAKEIKRRME